MRAAIVLVAALACAATVTGDFGDNPSARLRRRALAARRAQGECGDEGAVLAQIYTALGGAGWWQKGGWLTGDHCAGWYGVTCQLGRITYVQLGGEGSELQ